MTESTFSFTGKLNSSDLFTVRGNSISEFKANLVAAVEAIAEATALQTTLGGRGGMTSMDRATQVLADSGLIATPVTPTVTSVSHSVEAIEVIKDRYGNEWTYGHPDAPALPDGRGKYAKKKGVSKAGKAYVGWFDPAKGPKPFAVGAEEAETVWLKG